MGLLVRKEAMLCMMYLVCLLAVFTVRPATARQERSSAPSISPTKAPKNKFDEDEDELFEEDHEKTDLPTPSPTYYPTKFPSSEPSYQPSHQPTFSAAPSPAPSDVPTMVPSAVPSFFPTTPLPSFVPTSVPSLSPTTTTQPSFLPSNTPSISPTGIESTPLPWIDLFFRAPIDETTGKAKALKPLDDGLIQEAVTSFLNEFFATSVSKKSFRSLDANVILQSSNKYLITGDAFFLIREPPSEDILQEKLITYFSFWGIKDLKNHLVSAGISLRDAEIDIAVGGVRVNGMDTGTSDDVDNPLAARDQNSSSWEISLVVGTIIAVIALLGAMVFAAYKWRSLSASPSSKSPSWRESTASGGKRKLQPPGTPSTASPPKASPVEEFVADDLQSQSGLSGLYSMDESLFYDADKLTRKSPHQYDASRLDQVISCAKQTNK